MPGAAAACRDDTGILGCIILGILEEAACCAALLHRATTRPLRPALLPWLLTMVGLIVVPTRNPKRSAQMKGRTVCRKTLVYVDGPPPPLARDQPLDKPLRAFREEERKRGGVRSLGDVRGARILRDDREVVDARLDGSFDDDPGVDDQRQNAGEASRRLRAGALH